MLTALGERDAAICDAAWRAGEAQRVMTDSEGISVREAVRHGAVPANPTRELERLSAQPRRVPRALSRRSALDGSGPLRMIRSHCGRTCSICRRFSWRRVCGSGRRWQCCGAMLILTWVYCARPRP